MKYLKMPLARPEDQLLPARNPTVATIRDKKLIKPFECMAVRPGKPMMSVLFTRKHTVALMAVRGVKTVMTAVELQYLPTHRLMGLQMIKSSLSIMQEELGRLFINCLEELDPRKRYLAKPVSPGKPLHKLIEVELTELTLPESKHRLLRSLCPQNGRSASPLFNQILSRQNCLDEFGQDFLTVIAEHNPEVPQHKHFAVMWREDGRNSQDFSRSYIELRIAEPQPVPADVPPADDKQPHLKRISLNGRLFLDAKFTSLSEPLGYSQGHDFQSGWAFSIDPDDPDTARVVVGALNFLVRLSFEQIATVLIMINQDEISLNLLVSKILKLMGEQDICLLAGTIAALSKQNQRLAVLALAGLSAEGSKKNLATDVLVKLGLSNVNLLALLLDGLTRRVHFAIVQRAAAKLLAKENRGLFVKLLKLCRKKGKHHIETLLEASLKLALQAKGLTLAEKQEILLRACPARQRIGTTGSDAEIPIFPADDDSEVENGDSWWEREAR
jgi:hypothetical protein